MELNIRRLESDDAETAMMLVKQFHSSDVSGKRLEKLLSNEANFLIVAEIENNLVGFVWAYQLERLHKNPSVIFLYEIEVAADYQRKGIGAALINWACYKFCVNELLVKLLFGSRFSNNIAN